LCQSARAERSLLAVDGAWLDVYSATGCTADSSRVYSGAWWWPRTRSEVSALPRGGETHPPHIEDIAECGHLHHHGRTVALTHGELPLHPNIRDAASAAAAGDDDGGRVGVAAG
jgi:hypothetical protein